MSTKQLFLNDGSFWSKNEIKLNLRNANPICPILFIYCWKWCFISYTIIFDLKKNPFSGIEEINNFESQPNIALTTDGNGYYGLVKEWDEIESPKCKFNLLYFIHLLLKMMWYFIHCHLWFKGKILFRALRKLTILRVNQALL